MLEVVLRGVRSLKFGAAVWGVIMVKLLWITAGCILAVILVLGWLRGRRFPGPGSAVRSVLALAAVVCAGIAAVGSREDAQAVPEKENLSRIYMVESDALQIPVPGALLEQISFEVMDNGDILALNKDTQIEIGCFSRAVHENESEISGGGPGEIPAPETVETEWMTLPAYDDGEGNAVADKEAYVQIPDLKDYCVFIPKPDDRSGEGLEEAERLRSELETLAEQTVVKEPVEERHSCLSEE